MRDKTEGMDLFYFALALMGMGPKQSGETTQITNSQGNFPTVALSLGPEGWALLSSSLSTSQEVALPLRGGDSWPPR